VSDAAHPEANIIFGTVIDDALGEEVRVTVIAAGFDGGTPTYKAVEPATHAAPTQRDHTEFAAPEPPEPAPTQRVVFDDVDVPDFLKNGA
jgi:cell division protein FtsZ